MYFLEHARVIINSYACKFLPVSAVESVFVSSVVISSASVSDSADESITTDMVQLVLDHLLPLTLLILRYQRKKWNKIARIVAAVAHGSRQLSI